MKVWAVGHTKDAEMGVTVLGDDTLLLGLRFMFLMWGIMDFPFILLYTSKKSPDTYTS